MNASNENLKPANKHNPRIPYIAAENMGKAMLDLFLQEQKAAPDVWQKMSAQQQSETIERFRLRVQYAIAGAVNTIVTGGHTALAGTIDTVNIKDKIKLTVIVSKSNLSESLAELYASGSESSCQILLADAAQYCGGMDLVEADPDQRELFSDAGSVLPDDAFLWAINLPLMSGGASLIPAPNRKEAELFARSIREKLYELNQVDYAKSVYAHLWPLNNGEHTRSTNKGNWEAMINWFGQLCAGEVDIAPVALIGHAPDAAETGDAPEADESLIFYVSGTSGQVWIACGERVCKNKLDRPEALKWMTGAKVGESCMYEDLGWTLHPTHGGCSHYKVYPAIDLTDGDPRIKVTFTNLDGYRAKYSGITSTSTISARRAVDNLLKKMDVAGRVVEITTLDDIERDVQMFTVFAD